jgi:hypothetical protein
VGDDTVSSLHVVLSMRKSYLGQHSRGGTTTTVAVTEKQQALVSHAEILVVAHAFHQLLAESSIWRSGTFIRRSKQDLLIALGVVRIDGCHMGKYLGTI